MSVAIPIREETGPRHPTRAELAQVETTERQIEDLRGQITILIEQRNKLVRDLMVKCNTPPGLEVNLTLAKWCVRSQAGVAVIDWDKWT